MRVTLNEQIACIKRELAFRKIVYPKNVVNGKMTQAEADQELHRMQAVLTTLVKLTDEHVTVADQLPVESQYQKFVSVYDEFCKTRMGLGARMTPAQGKALKEIMAYLKEQSHTKDEAGALKAWIFILAHWDRVGDFIGKQKALTQINKNLVEILDKIRNGQNKQATTKNEREQYRLSLEARRQNRAG
jgi:hypothetical protein